MVPVDVFSIDTLQAGTVYTFDDYARNSYDIGIFEVDLFIQDFVLVVWVTLDGFCTRTRDALFGETSGGYCHFTYSLYDPTFDTLIGTFAAEGTFLDASSVAVLTVTGGTEALIGITGSVAIQPSLLDYSFSPPLLLSAFGGDVFDSVDGYVHELTLQGDPSFLII